MGVETVAVGIIDNLDRHGERPALMFPGGRTISYGELGARVASLAAELGATKRLIAVEAERSEHAVIAYLAALKGGHAVALLPSGCLEAIDAFEQDFAPDIVFRNVDGRWRRMETGQAALRGDVHDDLAVLLATSGSTGKARYVRLSRQAIEANARSIAAYLDLTAEDRGALILPFHYSYGLSVLNSHLAAGGCVYVAARSAADAGFAAELREAGCTNVSGVPYSYELMEKTGFLRESLPALRFMTAAGGRMPAPLAEAFRHHLAAQGKRFFLMYGQSQGTDGDTWGPLLCQRTSLSAPRAFLSRQCLFAAKRPLPVMGREGARADRCRPLGAGQLPASMGRVLKVAASMAHRSRSV